MTSWKQMVAALTLALTPSVAAGETIDLDEAIATALAKNPALRASDAGIEAARYTKKSGLARYRPMVRVTGNIILWDSASELSFLGGGGAGAVQLPPPQTPYEIAFAGMLAGFSGSTTVREQVTGEIGASIIQPLTPLITISDAKDLFEAGIYSEQTKKVRLEREIALQTATAYLRLLQAATMLETAAQSVKELEGQLERVDALVKGGVVGDSDRLALEVAVAARKLDVINTGAQVAMARAGLAVAMGLPVDAHVEPERVTTRGVPAPKRALVDAYAWALEHREEMQEIEAGERQLVSARALERSKHIPTVSAIAAYTHSEGSSFAESDSFFVGLFLEWNAFEWGATSYSVDKLSASLTQLERQREALEAFITLEVKQARLGLDASSKALAVADGATSLAEESLRLATRRFEEGDVTATDVLAAETALVTARNNRVAAYYQILVAHASYLKAIGAPLKAATLFPGGSDDQP